MLVKKIKLKPGYVLLEMGGEFNIFSEADKMNGSLVSMPSINELGIALWTQMEKGVDCEGLIKYTMERSGIDEEEAELDVGEFLAKLIHAGIVDCEK